MKNSTLRLSAAILGVLVTTALVAGATYAFQGDFAGKFRSHSDKWGGILEAIENNDYSALGENPKISEEDFNKKVEFYALMKSGDYSGAKELKKGLGMKAGHFGKMGKYAKFNSGKYEAVRTALDNNDYEAWLAAVGEDSKMAEKINEDNFSRLVEAHNLMQEAREIMEELGIGKWHK